jgi:ribonuclease P protein component
VPADAGDSASIGDRLTDRRYSFGKRQRVKRQHDFAQALAGKRESRGPLVIHAMPSTSKQSRLGIRIGRRCGSAPTRNRIKRLLREAFRLMQHDWPMPVDVVIIVRPHDVFALADYQRLMSSVMVRLCRQLKP